MLVFDIDNNKVIGSAKAIDIKRFGLIEASKRLDENETKEQN